MKPYIFAFIGTGNVRNRKAVLNSLLELMEGLCFDGDPIHYPVFYCGGYGEFSQLVSEAIDFARKRKPYLYSEKLFISPYNTPSYMNQIRYVKDFYDKILYPPLENVPEELAISRRNEWMIDQCNMLVVHLWYPLGDTRKSVEYAIRTEKDILYIK